MSVPAEVRRGESVTAAFRSRPGSACQLELRNAEGGGSQRLGPSVADPGGQVSWTWTVGGDLSRGQAGAYVVCSGGARGEAELTVT